MAAQRGASIGTRGAGMAARRRLNSTFTESGPSGAIVFDRLGSVGVDVGDPALASIADSVMRRVAVNTEPVLRVRTDGGGTIAGSVITLGEGPALSRSLAG